MLFTMEDMYLHTKFLTDMLGQVLGTVDAAVLAASTAKAEHQTGESPLDIASHMMVGQLIDGF